MSVCVNDTDGDGNCPACARNPEAPCRVSARRRIVDLVLRNEPDYPCDPETGHGLYGEGSYEAHVNKLLDAYAHELAERIRAKFDGSLIDDIREQDANLIDPEVLNSGG